jgi:NADP-dependent 3-hydroxy acid dehydrogenase YdfG
VFDATAEEAVMAVHAMLVGKTAVVTGASSGIGRAIAERLGSAGARVYLAGRSREPMEHSRRRIEDNGGKAEVVAFDVRDVDSLRSLVERAAEETGRLDVMVNNAGIAYGIGQERRIVDGTVDEWREMLDVNVLALLVGCQAAVEAMRRTGTGGHLVNISSSATRSRESSVYGATKHAVNCITATLREELADEDIRVVSVVPGVVATSLARTFEPEMVEAIAALAGVDLDWQRGDRLPDDVLDKAQSALDRQIARPADIADAVLYTVSPPLRLNVDEIVVRPAKGISF